MTDSVSPEATLPAIQVALAADDLFAMPMAATIASLVANLDPDHRLEITILDGGIKSPNVERIQALAADRCSLRWIRPESPRLDALVSGSTSNYPAANWFRLLLPELMPGSVDRVIYLDTDVVVEDSLAALWTLDLGGAWLAGAGHGFSIADAGHLAPLQLDIDASRPYHNAGVLLLDLGAWREHDVTDQVLEFMSHHADGLPFPDQDALNVSLIDRWVTVDPRWNQTVAIRNYADGRPCLYSSEQIREALDDPAVVHFTEVKPWVRACAHPEKHRFFHYLDQTPWVGWRPTKADETRRLARRAIRRGRKVAGRYLAKAGLGAA